MFFARLISAVAQSQQDDFRLDRISSDGRRHDWQLQRKKIAWVHGVRLPSPLAEALDFYRL